MLCIGKSKVKRSEPRQQSDQNEIKMEFKNTIILFRTILIALMLHVSTSEHFTEDCSESKVLCNEGVYAENACYSFKQAACLLKDIFNFTNIFTTTANWEKDVADRIAGFNETMYRQIFGQLDSVNDRLNKSIQEQFEVISNDVNKGEGGIKKLNDTLDKLSISTDHGKQEVSKMISSIRGDIKISISELRTNLEDQKREMSTELKQRVDETKAYLEHKSETLKSDLKELNLTFVETNNSLSKRIADMEDEFWINKDDEGGETQRISVKEEMVNIQKHFDASTSRLERNIKATEDSLKNVVETTQTRLQNEFDKKLNEFKANINKELKSARLEIEEIKMNGSYHKAIIDVILPNTFNKDFFMLAFMLLCLMVIVNFVVLLCYVTKSRSTSAMSGQWATGTGEMTGNHLASRSPLQVMGQLDFSRSLRQRRGLEAGISLVYFNGDVAPVITKVMLQISEHLPDQLSQQQISQYRIRRHDDIPGIPHSKLCFMFAEFHERHVIIEEPGLGLGDLKRSTVTAIEKLGANLVILYVLHPDSRRLRENELFHDAIYCTRKQPEVKKFADDERFLSLYDKCTDFQTQNLVKIIKETLF